MNLAVWIPSSSALKGTLYFSAEPLEGVVGLDEEDVPSGEDVVRQPVVVIETAEFRSK